MIADAGAARGRARHVAAGARLRLRGADAVCVAATTRLRLPLVTWGLEQREHATGIVDVFAPGPWPSRP